MLSRERPCSPIARLMPVPPRADLADRTLSALAFALFLVSWAVAYVAIVPPDAPRPTAHVVRTVAILEPGR